MFDTKSTPGVTVAETAPSEDERPATVEDYWMPVYGEDGVEIPD